MTEYKTEIVFDLTNPIEYHSKGQVEQAYKLTLKAPCNRVGRQCNQLKQGFMRALKSLADSTGKVDVQNTDKKESKEITSEEIIEVLQMSDIDYADYIDTFKSLMTNKIAMVTDDVALNSVMFDAISIDDTDKMLGEYLESFLLVAQLKKLKSN